ncbi:IS701 family transposase [Streptomyces lydicus]
MSWNLVTLDRASDTRFDDLSHFSRKVFDSVSRADQRGWAEVYLRGLLTTKGKKSLRNIAEQLGISGSTQSLQQFINQSPWDWRRVETDLSREIHKTFMPKAWILDDVVVQKRGRCSVGVDQFYVPKMRKSVNGQIGMGIFLSSTQASTPVSWRIILSDRWLDDKKLAEKAYVPSGYGIQTAWQASLSLLDAMRKDAALPERPVLADFRGLRGADALIRGLIEREMDYFIELDPSVQLVDDRPNRPPYDRYGPRGDVRSLTDLAAAQELKRRAKAKHSHGVQRTSHLAMSSVRLPGSGHPPAMRLLTEWPASARHGEPRFWLTNLTTWSLRQLMQLRSIWNRHDAEVRSFQDDYGVRDFEGRSFIGWHHQMTMASAAFAFSKLGCMRLHALGVASDSQGACDGSPPSFVPIA